MKIFPYISEIIGATMFACLTIPMKTINLHFIYKSFITCLVLFISSTTFILLRKNKQKKDFQIRKVYTRRKNIILSSVYTFFIVGLVFGFEQIPVSVSVPLFALLTPFTIFMGRMINHNYISLKQIISIIIILDRKSVV